MYCRVIINKKVTFVFRGVFVSRVIFYFSIEDIGVECFVYIVVFVGSLNVVVFFMLCI